MDTIKLPFYYKYSASWDFLLYYQKTQQITFILFISHMFLGEKLVLLWTYAL